MRSVYIYIRIYTYVPLLNRDSSNCTKLNYFEFLASRDVVGYFLVIFRVKMSETLKEPSISRRSKY